MFAPSTVIIVILLYMAFMFAIAQWAEHRAQATQRPNHPLIYALSFNVYSTSWAFYGAVGFAVSAGWMYTAFDSGAVFGILFAGLVMRKMIHLKERFRITSLADLLSTRYNRSQTVAIVVTLILLTAIIPYIALQLKAVVTTFSLLTSGQTEQVDWAGTGTLIVGLMIIFTVMFGVRRLDPTERHQGMMTALAIESLVKLLTLIIIGLFVTFVLYDGSEALFAAISEQERQRLFSFNVEQPGTLWVTNFMLGVISIYLLPRQFHIGVIENGGVRQLTWLIVLTPIYLFLIKLFVLPLAAAGLALGLPATQADSFVMLIPQQTQNSLLALMVFIGGFSAATAMIIVSTMTLSTMVSNHLILPVLEQGKSLSSLRGYLLQIRWLAVTLILISSFVFAWTIGESQMLVALGSLSFGILIQLAPATLAGLYWSGGNRTGALLGFALGFTVWAYTLLLPTLIQQGWFSPELLTSGPAAIHWLRPQALFGFDGLPATSHCLLWSLLFNICGYLFGSLHSRSSADESALALQFVRAKGSPTRGSVSRPLGLREYIAFSPKLSEARHLLTRYVQPAKADELLNNILEDLNLKQKDQLSMIELVEFHWLVEKVLAGSIGAAAAHKSMERHIEYSERESNELKMVHAHILSELQCTPGDKKEPHTLSLATSNSPRDLEENLRHLQSQQQQIEQLQQQINTLEQRLEQQQAQLFEQRLESQRLQSDKSQLEAQLEDYREKLDQERWRNKRNK